MNKKTKGLVSLTFEIKDLVNELKTDYEYLSEEIDRWVAIFDYNKPKRGESESYEFVREHIKQFEKIYPIAINAKLGKSPLLSKILKKGVEYAICIKTGDFLRLNSILENMKDRI